MNQHHTKLKLRELALDALALLWPTACAGCGALDRELCDGCRDEIVTGPPAQPLVRVDGAGAPCYAASEYAGALRSVLLSYKHGGAYGFVRPLGARLRTTLVAALAATPETTPDARPGARPGSPMPLVVPAPSRRQRTRERGWRHVDELVRVALLRGRLPLERCSALAASRGRTGQVGLSAVAREANASRITVRRSKTRTVHGRSVVLVDDIVTTGATARAAVAALEAAGATVVAVVALCSAVRRDAPQKTEWNLTGERG
ncbi:ComF family protein [Leucobacter albus]|uniref:ComF family protein n=1 Tax=Leucobacter albus TaxID=272210 RepID=A0ABW3TPR3_9MICO